MLTELNGLAQSIWRALAAALRPWALSLWQATFCCNSSPGPVACRDFTGLGVGQEGGASSSRTPSFLGTCDVLNMEEKR